MLNSVFQHSPVTSFIKIIILGGIIMENMGIARMAKELENLNPHVQFDFQDYSPFVLIYGTVPGENLNLPDGYYYNDKNGITNKHNTTSGLYECFRYLNEIEHFTPKEEPKKSWFARIFAR